MSTPTRNPMRKGLSDDAARRAPERQHMLLQMVSSELILMRSVAIKLGGALLVLEALFRLAAVSYAPEPGAATLVAGAPAPAQAAPRTRISSLHAVAPRQPQAGPVAR